MRLQPHAEAGEGEPGAAGVHREAEGGEPPPAGAAAPHAGAGPGEPESQQQGDLTVTPAVQRLEALLWGFCFLIKV